MSSSVLLKGLPPDVPIHVLAYHLDKFLDTDEIGTFKVKELPQTSSTSWQIVINFKSSYDAFTAQSILQGFKYKWKDDEDFVLQAKVSTNPRLQSSDWQTLANETWGHSSSSLVQHMSQEDVRSCNDMLDNKLKLLRKQKLVLQTEREVVEEKRKLEREYRKRHNNISDSEDEDTAKHRSRKAKRAKEPLKSRVRTTSDGSGSKRRRSKSRSNSSSRPRSRANLRSVVREISPDHSRSRAVSRSIVREIPAYHTNSPPISTSPDSAKALAVYKPSAHPRSSRARSTEDRTDLEYFESHSRTRYRCSWSPVRHRSPESSSYDRPKSRHYSELYRRSRSRESSSYDRPKSRQNSKLYRRSGSPDLRTHGRYRSPDSMSYGRSRSRKYTESCCRPRSPDYRSRRSPGSSYRSRSPYYPRSSRRSKDVDADNESPDRFSSGHGWDKSRGYDDNEAACSKDDQKDNTKTIDITISVKRIRTSTLSATSVITPKEIPSTETDVSKDVESTPIPTNTENIVIKQEAEYDNDNKDKDFKLQMNIAIHEVMTMSQGLIDIMTNNCLRGSERNSVMTTLQRILARRLRFLPLDQYMVADDIVHVYRYTHTEKDDSVLIKKLIDQLSDPKIVIEDSDSSEPPDGDNKIWSIIDQVLEDFKIDCFSDDDTETVIVGKPEYEIVDGDIFSNENNIKTEKNDEDIKPDIVAINKLVWHNASDTNVVPEATKKRRRNKKNKCGPRNKITHEIPDSEKEIPQNPKFVITVKNVLKAMKPHIYELRGNMSLIRILDITTYEIRRKIGKLVQGKGYMRSAAITKLYRERYPKDKDLNFVWKIVENFKNGLYRDLTQEKFADYIEKDNSDNELIETTQAENEETDDVIIVEKNDVIVLEEDEGNVVEQAPQVPCIKIEKDVPT